MIYIIYISYIYIFVIYHIYISYIYISYIYISYIYDIYIYIIDTYTYHTYIYIYRVYNPILHWIFHWIPCGRILRSLPYRSKPERSVRLMQAASLESWKLRIENITCTYIYIYIYIYTYIIYFSRRKFRSQTSDNMDRWKAEQRRGREKRKIRREKIRRERVRRKKMQMREKVGKSRNTLFFQCFVAPEGRKVGSLKRRVRSQLARWEMTNCTPLWRQAHFEVKMYKAHHARTTFN